MGDEYFVYGALPLLDAEGEWFYDATEGRLYLMPPGGADPNQLPIESRARELGFELGLQSYIEIAGFRLFSAGFGGALASHVLLDGVHVRYPVHQLATDGQSLPDAGNCRLGTASVFRNGSVTQSSHSGLVVVGNDNLVQNSFFSDVDYSGALSAGIHTQQLTTTGNVFTHNTIRRSAIFGIRFDGLTEGELSYNDVSGTCISCPDCGPVYAGHTNGLGTQIAYNVVAAPPAQDLTNGIYLDDVTEGFVVHHNLVKSYAMAGIMVKGPSDVFNNTVLPSGQAPIGYMKKPTYSPGDENADLSSMTVGNNLVSSVPGLVVQFSQDTSAASDAGFRSLVPGSLDSHSYEVSLASLLQPSYEHPPVTFDPSALSGLIFLPSTLNGAFDIWLDDVTLVSPDGQSELLLDDFADGDEESELTGNSWWSEGGNGSSVTATVETDPTTGSVALHYAGDVTTGGWALLGLVVTDVDFTQYSTLRFTARTSGTLHISSPDGDPTLANNADCPLDDAFLPSADCALDQGLEYPPITDGFLGTAPDLGAFELGAEPWTAGATTTEPDWSTSPAPEDYPETIPVSDVAYTTELIDDFEDGELSTPHVAFSTWWSAIGEGSVLVPEPLAPIEGGAEGSGYALGLSGTGAVFAHLGVNTTADNDLSAYAGLRFSARGTGALRVSIQMASMIDAGDYNNHDMLFSLTDDWQSFELLFDDSRLIQRYSGNAVAFDPSAVRAIQFSQFSTLVDFAIDNVVLLRRVELACP